MHIYMYTYIYVYIYIYTYAYTYIYIRTHTSAPSPNAWGEKKIKWILADGCRAGDSSVFFFPAVTCSQRERDVLLH